MLAGLIEQARQNAERAERPLYDGTAMSGGSSPSVPDRVARLTAYNNTGGGKNYTGVLQSPNGLGGFADASPGETFSGSIFEQSNFIGIEIGSIVEIKPAGSWTGSASVLPTDTPIFTFEFVKPRETFEVDVVQTGGSNGTATTQASWTYRVNVVGGTTQIGTALSPVFKGPRLSAGLVTAGTTGIASYTAAGVLRLLEVNEVHGTNACAA